MAFSMDDLQYNYDEIHSWDNPKLKGHPDRDLLSRTEKYEVFTFITTFLHSQNKSLSKQNGQIIEKLIKTEMPSNIHSRTKANEWLIKKLNSR
ncbi:hypothetical protein Ga0466249_002772 [Sporomusaceae bacterium BoRhaA]|uniref:hypothetical protein n=1 Tax=Pelorhabdus rhamnosifermentans TaxID=2772457 RepID=UPI001C0639C1|nr:hypothetical protein [Pelorhabdus rhamnosifermentans]MBU2701653.1 hypothetical protein [Pelorhabdus rhamnosifermentans]